MIPSISMSSLSFKANKKNPVRDLYANLLSTIKTAQDKAGVTGTNNNPLTPIPMQGTGQKLDVIA